MIQRPKRRLKAHGHNLDLFMSWLEANGYFIARAHPNGELYQVCYTKGVTNAYIEAK
jgi:hypothetical protein